MFQWQNILEKNKRKVNLLIIERSEKQRYIFEGLLDSVEKYFTWKINENIDNIEIPNFDIVIIDFLSYKKIENRKQYFESFKEICEANKLKFILSFDSEQSENAELILSQIQIFDYLEKPINVENLFAKIAIEL
jgi:DNA-binding NtrC family response regulator